MTNRKWWGLAVAGLLVSACTNTFIDLTPDSGDVGATDDIVEPDADVADDGSGVVILPPPPCGDGVVDPGEECDDGNRLNDDGCTLGCMFGAGDPPGDPDPAALPYRAEIPPQVLSPVDHPPEADPAGSPFPVSSSATLFAGSWLRPDMPDGTPPSLNTRFLAPDGSLAREDVTISLVSGSSVSGYAVAARSDSALLAWRAGPDGISHANLSVEAGLTSAPTLLINSRFADLPALAGLPDSYMFAWYDGGDTARCVHNGAGPSRILLRRLTTDGTTDGMPDPVALEDENGAWTAPDLAAGDDGSVGILWWRTATEAAGGCTLRFGVADSALTTIADGGVVGPGRSGRIADAEGAFRLAWRDVAPDDTPRIGFAAFGRDASLLAPPVVHQPPFLPFEFIVGDIEFAAGDHGLVAVFEGYNTTTGPQLWFLRTDLLGRAVGSLAEVDPSCTGTCTFGPSNVVWSGDAFLVIYFVTLNLGEPSETTEMRMVRLVPEV